ncbi:hypothetical protein BSL78_13878 [Apostichopus japonicus]|uniref:Uncharacterized protein n=1 Tax=Stichopus japonicus TaxID=307972 RepID=A0A2G8KMK6_STIJA|nr:hypothetical protein BSL78_13878 [Apostichopus japonicus]
MVLCGKESCGANLPEDANFCLKCGEHVEDPSDSTVEENIRFDKLECDLQPGQLKSGFMTIRCDTKSHTKELLISPTTGLDESLDLSKFEIETLCSPNNHSVRLISTPGQDFLTLNFSFKNRNSYNQCCAALLTTRPTSSVEHDRRSPSVTPRGPNDSSTVGKFSGISVLQKQNCLQEVISKNCHCLTVRTKGLSGESTSSSECGTISLKDEMEGLMLSGAGCIAQNKRKREVTLTKDQLNSLQLRRSPPSKIPIVTRGATFNNVTIREGDEILQINKENTDNLEMEDLTEQELKITFRPCQQALSFPHIQNTGGGLGITWDGNVVVDITDGPFVEEALKKSLTEEGNPFCLTHCNGYFIPLHRTNPEKKQMQDVFRKAGDKLSLIFQPVLRMKAVAGR